ncbi:MAG: chemotaxis protein CheW [Aquificota bacterium]|nr:chemotaxis protein CheW [Aquificota bacterium]
MGELISLLVFRVKDQEFSCETDTVVETVRVDRVFPVPLAPNYIRGVMNLRNNVIPLVDVRSLLWGERSSGDTAVIVQEGDRVVGLLVDTVVGIHEVSPKEVRKVREEEVEGIKREFVRGTFKRNNRVIFLIDLKPITGVKRPARRRGEVKRVSLKDSGGGVSRENLKGFVIFPGGGEWFALPVEEVREIIDYPSSVSRIPGAPEYMEGVFLLRGEELVLVSFCRALGVGGCGEEKRAIVVSPNLGKVALGVEDVKEIRWVDEKSLLHMDKEGSRGVLALDGGERLVLVLSVSDVVRREDVEGMSGRGEERETGQEVKEMRSFVSFTVGGVEMAIAIEKVKEVIEVGSLTPMPGAPDHVEGVYNLRNSVIAVSSLPKRLGIDGEESDKVIVLENIPVGFRVTKLKGILRVEEKDIQPADQITEAEEKVLEGVIRTGDGGVIFVLDPKKLVKEEDIKFLKEGVAEDEGKR